MQLYQTRVQYGGHLTQRKAEECAEWRVVQAPILQVVVWSVNVPRCWGQVDSYLHPMALGLVVAVHGGRRLTGVSVQRDARTDEEPNQTERQLERGGVLDPPRRDRHSNRANPVVPGLIVVNR
eukprot:scaffold37101_cov33-Tisochrysis_lutea.AAC.2